MNNDNENIDNGKTNKQSWRRNIGLKQILQILFIGIIVVFIIMFSIHQIIDLKINSYIKNNEINNAYKLLNISYNINLPIFKKNQFSLEKFYKMACIDFSIGNTEQSLEKFYYIEKNLKNKKTEIYLSTLANIISINYLNGDYENAKKYIKLLIINRNENIEILSFLVKFSYLLQNNEDTLKYYKKFIEVNPNNEKDKFIYILNLIEIYSMFNQDTLINKKDIDYILHFMNNEQTDYTKYFISNALAEYYLKQKNKEKSLFYTLELEKFIEEYNPSSLRYYFYVSYLMYRNNEIDKALQVLEKLKYDKQFTEKNNKYKICLDSYTDLYLKNININNVFCRNLLEIRGI